MVLCKKRGEVVVKPVYIVISQTGTVLSRILKLITHKEYNHASLSLYDDLHIMYSFGRKRPYNPFFAGFVTESASFGTFKRFSNTRVIVVKLFITSDEYKRLENLINLMISNQKSYKYNYLGLYLAALKIPYKSKNRYYCSEFVKDILINHNVTGAESLEKIVHPMSFLKLPQTQTVYTGKLKDFTETAVEYC